MKQATMLTERSIGSLRNEPARPLDGGCIRRGCAVWLPWHPDSVNLSDELGLPRRDVVHQWHVRLCCGGWGRWRWRGWGRRRRWWGRWGRRLRESRLLSSELPRGRHHRSDGNG